MNRVIRGTVTALEALADDLARVTVSEFEGQEIEDVEVFMGAGIHPPAVGEECVLVKSGSDHLLIAAADRRNAKPWSCGDRGIYTSDGQYIVLKATGDIDIVTNGDVTVTCNRLSVNGGALEVGDFGV